MAVPAIHPGEHLTEELKELNMSACAPAQGAHEPRRRDSQRPSGRRRRYRSAPRVLLGTSAESGSTCKSSTSYALPRREPAR